MEFLSQYGLFLLKIATLVIAILVLAAGIIAIGRKPRSKIEVTSLNKKYTELQHRMLHEVKDHKKVKSKVSKKDKKIAKMKPSLFVIDFHGDIKASQTEELREAITAILMIADDKDEVLVRLDSPGGIVNGYGLAASQLQRIRDKKIHLTVAIDKMAASGGYLMACVANRIIASPFAIIGSIGVVAQIPNFHRWLKQHDIDFELFTAGEFKRTVTLFGENTEKGKQKFQEDLELIHKAFREYVLSNRQQLDIDKVSTGEHWLGKDAFDLRLVDSLKTSDEFLMNKLTDFNVFQITVHAKHSVADRILKPLTKALHPWA
ncbi:protease SohB [Legionella spiritensis]|nr:protease SohB [Legionella spiritensis]